MDCTQVREELSALMDGELTPARRTEVEAHLSQCSACLREAHALQQVDTLFHTLPKLETPPEFNETVHRIIQAANPDAPIRFEHVRRMRMRMWPLLATAVMLMVIIAAILPRIASQSRKQQLATVPATGTASTATAEKAISEIGVPVVPVPPASATPRHGEAETSYSFDNANAAEDKKVKEKNTPSPDLIHAKKKEMESPSPQAAPVTNGPTKTGVDTGGMVKSENSVSASISSKGSFLLENNRDTPQGNAADVETKINISSAGGFETAALPKNELPNENTSKAKASPAPSVPLPDAAPSPKRPVEIGVANNDTDSSSPKTNASSEERIASTSRSPQQVVTKPESTTLAPAEAAPSPAPAPPVKEKISVVVSQTQETKPQENERRIIEGANFDYKEGVWRQEGYKGEKVEQLAPESDTWKALLKDNPKLGAFRQLAPKVILKIAEKWYCIG